MDTVYDDFQMFEYYNEDYQLYSITVPSEWDYTQVRPYKGDLLKEKRRIYIHLYYNIDRATEDRSALTANLWA